MSSLLLNGLEAIKYRQDGDTSDRPRRQPWMAVENEFNDKLIMPEVTWCGYSALLPSNYSKISLE